MDRKSIKIIENFLRKLKKDFSVEKVIFFGSRAEEDYFHHSDIDLIIVSKDFKGIEFPKRISKMYDYWNWNYDVDFFCYTPEEFKKLSKMVTIVREALNKGIVLT